MTVRKVAANRVYIHFPEFYTNHVVELTDHVITNHYPLTAELPHTEWLGGTIVIKNQHAYHTKNVLSPEEDKTDNICITDMAML